MTMWVTYKGLNVPDTATGDAGGYLTCDLKSLADRAGPSNFTATVDPTASDDSSEGYEVGSMWVNTSTNDWFVCTNNSSGNAVWLVLPRFLIATSTSTSLTLDETYGTLLMNNSSDATVNLPAAAGCTGRIYGIVKVGANTNLVTIAPNGSDTVNGRTTYVLNRQYNGVLIQSNGSNWFVLARYGMPRSEIWLDTGNGFGSTNTKIRRFYTAELNVGTAITYADNAASGASFTINEDGIYAITYSDTMLNSGATISTNGLGISLNAGSTQLATSITTISAANRIALSVVPVAATGQAGEATFVGRLSAGDVVRPHSTGLTTSMEAIIAFHIVKIDD